MEQRTCPAVWSWNDVMVSSWHYSTQPHSCYDHIHALKIWNLVLALYPRAIIHDNEERKLIGCDGVDPGARRIRVGGLSNGWASVGGSAGRVPNGSDPGVHGHCESCECIVHCGRRGLYVQAWMNSSSIYITLDDSLPRIRRLYLRSLQRWILFDYFYLLIFLFHFTSNDHQHQSTHSLFFILSLHDLPEIQYSAIYCSSKVVNNPRNQYPWFARLVTDWCCMSEWKW